MSTEKNKDAIDTSKITEKEKTVIKHKLDGKIMKELESSTGITEGYGNNLFQTAKRKTGLTSGELLIWAYKKKLTDKKK